MNNERVIHSVLNYDEFRSLTVHPRLVENLISSEEDYAAYLAYEMVVKGFDLSREQKVNRNVWNQIKKVQGSKVYEELYSYYRSIFSDLMYFPIPNQASGEEYVTFENSWGAQRTYGGNRLHEGTDIMTSNNVRGYFPIISVSDGVIEKKGWLPQGGYRIGVRAPSGTYFYYAHLYNYAPDLEEGDEVKAGQLLGFMGDSGYGEEGTVGQFDVHLHFGIYLNFNEDEISVNSYWILKYLEQHKLTFDYK